MSKKFSFLLFFSFLLIPISYFFVDIPIAIYFNGIDELVKEFFDFITEFGESQYILVTSFMLFIYFRLRLSQIYASRALFVWFSVAVSGILVNIIKPILARPRPNLFFGDNLYGFEFFQLGQSWSFPSGHSATAFSLAMALALISPKNKIYFFIAAFLIAFSRVVLNAHFFSDVIAGAIIGILTVAILERYFAKHKCYNIYQNSCTLVK